MQSDRNGLVPDADVMQSASFDVCTLLFIVTPINVLGFGER